MIGRKLGVSSGVIACTMAMAACGNGDGMSAPAGPSTTAAVTISITDSGVSPASVVIATGAVVAFVNNSSVNRDMSSGPHPVHTDCPPINQTGVLAPGATGQTGPLTLSGVCSFHDHLTDGADTWAGLILVGTSDASNPTPVY